MPAIKAVIFDMDGVLIDAKEWHYEAMNQALAKFGHTISCQEHLTQFDGLPTRQKLELISAKTGFPRRLHAAVSELKQHLTMALIEAHCRPRLPHVRALSRLKRAGYALGVASNSIRHTVQRMMDLSGLSTYLDFQLSNEDVSRPKPSPEIYLRAAQLAGVSPAQCVVIEDNPYGIEAATLAGANVLPVTGVEDVTYERIDGFIAALPANGAVAASAARRAA